MYTPDDEYIWILARTAREAVNSDDQVLARQKHRKTVVQGQTGTTFGMATITTDITWLLPTDC